MVKGTFSYTRIRRRNIILIPTYTLSMVIISVDRHLTSKKIIFLIILFVLGILIGQYQASGVTIKDQGKVDRFKRPIIMAKRNWPYLTGWIFIFIIDISIQIYFGIHMNTDEVTNEFIDYILKNLNPIFMVFFHTDWYIWTITAASYFGYYRSLVIRFPKVRQILKAKHVVKHWNILVANERFLHHVSYRQPTRLLKSYKDIPRNFLCPRRLHYFISLNINNA